MEAKGDKAATARGSGNGALSVERKDEGRRAARRRRLAKACGGVVVLVVIVAVVGLILALTVFKPRDPRTELVSAELEGVSPRLTFPAVSIELNVTLDLKLLVKNRNYAGFRHGAGESRLVYRGKQVGEAELFAGSIPARGSATIPCRLTLEVDQLGSDLGGLISDVLAGEISVEATTMIPGRVSFLGFIKKHVVAVSECSFTIGIGIGEFKVRSQVCKNRTKL